MEYGNIFGVAFAKQELDSGYCDTSTTYSDDQVVNYYVHRGTLYVTTAYGPYSFSSWVQGTGTVPSSIYGAEWVICMQITVGNPSAGDQCLVLTSSPL